MNTHAARAAVVLLLVLGAGMQSTMAAQTPDTLHLGALQRAAETTDRRAIQTGLLSEQSALRLRSLRAERLPSLALQGQAQHLSDVTSFGSGSGSPLAIPEPFKTQYDASASIQLRLYDPTIGDREAIERAQLGAATAGVRTTLWQQRQQVNEAFFAVVRLDAQAATLEAVLSDLEAQRRVAVARVVNGVALPSDTLLLDAAIASRRQDRDQVTTNAQAYRQVLAELTGQPVPDDAVLVAPDLATQVAALGDRLGGDRARPEYARFDASEALIATRRDATDAAEKPRFTAFVRGGYGRPGLNQLSRAFDSYYQAGVRVDWSPWHWGTADRDREVQAIQARILASDEAAFTETIRRATIRDLATIETLQRSLDADDRIIALREAVLAETRTRFEEGVITSAEYVDRETDLLAARLDHDSHRASLAGARARLLTTIGHEVR